MTGHTTAKLRRSWLVTKNHYPVHGTGACRTVSESKFRAVENYKNLERFLDCDMEEMDSYLYSVEESVES